MRTNGIVRHLLAGTAAVALIAGFSAIGSQTGTDLGFVSKAAAQGQGKMQGQQGGQGGQGGQGAGQGGQGGGGKGGPGGVPKASTSDDGDDSDRPKWAGVPGGEDRPGGGGNPLPGTTKGDLYGDLILLVRDPVTGLAILAPDADNNLWPQACTSEDCSTSVLMVNNEVPEGETTFEVDFGRASVVRAPATVVAHSLDEALSKLTADGAVISTDPAGRITITVGGVTSTIDSPLENLALYIDLLKGLAEGGSATVDALGALASLDTAASLLAGVADKTGDISLDYLVNENVFAGLAEAGDVYSFDGFEYDRDYPTDYTFWYTPDGVVAPVQKTININDYLAYVNGSLPADDQSAALFAAAADDAVEVIELVHTQIVTDDFLNGYVLP